jgi:hypothetical protein
MREQKDRKNRKRFFKGILLLMTILVCLSACGKELEPRDDPAGSGNSGKIGENSDPTGGPEGNKDKDDKGNGSSNGSENGNGSSNGSENGNGGEGSSSSGTEKDKTNREGVIVTAVRGDKREDFIFDEHYAAFSDQNDHWTLDLNGNTVVVLETIDVKSDLTVINGKIIVACDLGFRCTAEEKTNVAKRLTFKGEDGKPLEFSVHEDCIGCAFNGYVRFDSVKINVLGVFGIPDISGCRTLFNYGENEFDAGGVQNCIITVNKGAFFSNPGSAYHVSFESFFSDNRLFLYEGAIGFENHGSLKYPEYGFNEVVLDDGIYIKNHEGAECLAGGSATNLVIYALKGQVFINEGYMKAGANIVIEEGNALYNSGEYLGTLNVSTIPAFLYRDVLIRNTESGIMNLSGMSVIYTGEGATAVDNSGSLELGMYVILGYPKRDYSNYYTYENGATYRFLTGMMKEIPDRSNNILKSCRGIVNRNRGLITKDMVLSVNATASAGSSYTDKTLGLLNMPGARVEIGKINLYLYGEDAYGVYNDIGAVLTGMRDGWKRCTINACANPTEKSAYRSDYLDALAEKKGFAKNIVVFLNNSNEEQAFAIEAEICGDHCTGFINEAKPVLNENLSISIQMYGDDNTGLVNKGELTDPQHGTDIGVSAYGKGNTAVDNSGKIYANTFGTGCAGDKALMLLNSGEIEMYTENGAWGSLKIYYLWEDQVGTGKDVTGLDNRGKIRAGSVQCNFTTVYDRLLVDGGVLVKNGAEGAEGGEISGNLTVSSSGCDNVTLLINYGTVRGIGHDLNISGNKGSGLCAIKNYGTLEANVENNNTVTIFLGKEVRSSRLGTHEGIIRAGMYIRISYYQAGGNEGLVENGTYEFTSEFRYIYYDENDKEHLRVWQYQNGVLHKFQF